MTNYASLITAVENRHITAAQREQIINILEATKQRTEKLRANAGRPRKLDRVQVAALMLDYATREQQALKPAKIAEKYGVSTATLYNVIRREELGIASLVAA